MAGYTPAPGSHLPTEDVSSSPHDGAADRFLVMRPGSPQSVCWLDEQRKLGTRCLILDELPFPAALRQLAAVLVAREEHSFQKSFASVSNENKVRFLGPLVGIAWNSQHELVFPFVFAAKGDDSGSQLLDRVAARFQRGPSY